jgi:hypothetical protein
VQPRSKQRWGEKNARKKELSAAAQQATLKKKNSKKKELSVDFPLAQLMQPRSTCQSFLVSVLVLLYQQKQVNVFALLVQKEGEKST